MNSSSNTSDRRLTVHHRIVRGALWLLTLGASLSAAEPARHEIWVPSKHWAEIQKQHPSAVNLTPEQYDALIRDAAKAKPEDDPKLKPPVEAVVERILFSGRIDPNRDTASFTGEVMVRSFTDQWTSVDIRLPFQAVTSVAADAQEHLALSPADTNNQRRLLVRGKGTHKLLVEATAQVTASNEIAKQSLPFWAGLWPGELQVELPAQAKVINTELRTDRVGNVVHVPLMQPASKGTRILNWNTGDNDLDRRTPSKNPNLATVKIQNQILTAEWSLALEQLGDSASERTIELTVTPNDAVIESLTGDAVKQWEAKPDGQLIVVFQASHPTPARIKATVSVPLNVGDQAQAIAIPTITSPSLTGNLVTSTIGGQGSPDDPKMVPLQITQALQARIDAIDDDLALLEVRGDLSHWIPGDSAPELMLRKAKPRVIVDADAVVNVTRDDLRIERTLGVSTDRPINELRVTLPADEQFDDTAPTRGPAVEWKRVGQTIEYHWPASLPANQQSMLTLRSRKLFTEDKAMSIAPVAVTDAAKLTGYIALNYDTTWRVTITDVTGLEERDVKLTPVKGRMAWFTLRDFTLGFTVQRRDPVIDVEAVAYALPRARSIEIEGLLNLRVSDAPLREFKVRFDKASAPNVRFTSENIGTQKLDADTGEWSLTLRQETQGVVPVRWAVSLKSEDSGQASEGKDQKSDASAVNSKSEDTTYTLPVISLPASRRFMGTWVIEANTDTEISFAPTSMQPLDVLRAPEMPGYQPRHRLVAAYTFATPESSLVLHAARHGHSELAALVVNSLLLRSVLAPDGSARHEAMLQVQHSGEQFITIALPKDALLLSAIAGNDPVKPVHGPNGTVSVPLPATSANEPRLSVRLLYESQSPAWTASGRRHLDPPTIPGNVPVLSTDWQVFAPDGFSFRKVTTDMEQEGTGVNVGSWAEAWSRITHGDLSREITEFDGFLPGGGNRAPGKRKDSDDMVTITPNWPKPMFVGTPVPFEYKYKAAEGEKPTDLPSRPDAKKTASAIQHAQELKRQQVLGKPPPLNKSISASANASLSLPTSVETQGSDVRQMIEKMRAIRIPTVSFAGATIEDAIEFLRVKSRDLDQVEADAALKGVNLILKQTDPPSSAKITLDLKDVPMDEALRYVTELAGMTYKIEPTAVVITPITDSTTEQVTRVFKVPADFLTHEVSGVAGAAPADPFAKPDLSQPQVRARRSGKEVLQDQGIQFPEGASAVFNPTTNELIVKNTMPNLDLAEAAVSSLGGRTSGLRAPTRNNFIKESSLNQLWVDINEPSSGFPKLDPSSSIRAVEGFDFGTNSASLKSGLLSLALDLPTSGQVLRFRGLQAPASLEIPYVSWERQVSWALMWLLAGAGLFVGFGRRRPVMLTLLAVIVLAVGTGLILADWQATANAVLLGWLAALVVGTIWRALEKTNAWILKRRAVV